MAKCMVLFKKKTKTKCIYSFYVHECFASDVPTLHAFTVTKETGRRVSGSPELLAVGTVWVLGTQLWSLARTASVPNQPHCPFSLEIMPKSYLSSPSSLDI